MSNELSVIEPDGWRAPDGFGDYLFAHERLSDDYEPVYSRVKVERLLDQSLLFREMNMTTNDLIDDLMSRINPAYANQRGTESYERRLCAEALYAQQQRIAELKTEIERLRVAIARTLDENGHLSDGDNCTLIHLVRADGGR